MALSTKDVKTGGGGGIPKTIQPGNTEAQILGIRLDQPHFLQKNNEYYVILDLMGPKPTEDFQGFFLDKNNESLGRYEGPVGRVKASRWSYKDGKTKSGKPISRDMEIMKFVKDLCDALGGKAEAWWNASDEKYNTIEELVEAFNSDAPFKGESLSFCICGREYHNQEGYVNHDLFLPKFSRDGAPFVNLTATDKKVLVFDEATCIEKAEPQDVDNFSGDENEAPEGDTLTEEDLAGMENPDFDL